MDLELQILTVVLYIMGAVAFGILAYGFFYFADTLFLKKKIGEGTISSSVLCPSHTEMMLVGRVLMPRIVPDVWYNTVEIKNVGTGEFTSDEKYKVGLKFKVTYSHGRFTNSLVIQ